MDRDISPQLATVADAAPDVEGMTLTPAAPAWANADGGLPDSLMPFCRAPHQFLLELAQQDRAPRFRMNDEIFMVLSDPASVFAVLNGGFGDFDKGAMIEIPRASWRDGIISVEGDGWTEQHELIAPQFVRRRIRELEPFIAARVTRLIEGWSALPAGEPVDILAAANRLAFDLVAADLLGIRDQAIADGLFETLVQLDGAELVRLNYLAKRFGAGMQSGFGRSSHFEAIERVHHLTLAVADARLAGPATDGDFLGAIMATEAFQAYPPERQRAFLADQIATMLAAGYVTTGESLFWNLYLLAKHPAAQQRARAEALANTGAGCGVVPVDAPPYVAAAYNESLRLYPPIWFLGRVARRDVRVGDIAIAAGTRVICSPYVLQRMPDLWPQADAFRPERFLPGAAPPITPRSFIPFGLGMRACLGRGMALMEVSAVICMTLARFELELVADAPVTLTAAFSMHPRDPVLFRLKPL